MGANKYFFGALDKNSDVRIVHISDFLRKTTLHPRRRHLPIATPFLEIWTTLSAVLGVLVGLFFHSVLSFPLSEQKQQEVRHG